MNNSEVIRLIDLEDEYGSPSVGLTDETPAASLLMAYELSHRNENKKYLQELTARGYIESATFSHELIALTQNIIKTASSAYFRSSYDAAPEQREASPAFMLWIGVITSQANELDGQMPPYEGSIDLEYLRYIARLSVRPERALALREILAQKGIVLLFEPGLTGMKTDGAFITLPNGRPVIALTLRYKRVDYFWYTLLHELAHVALHYDANGVFFNDDTESTSNHSLVEFQADKLALEAIISRSLWRRSVAYKRRDSESIHLTAQEMEVHPSLIAGRLRRELNAYDLFSPIVDSIDMRRIIYGQ